ncbi:MAG: pyruvate flavodoxin/ferredoxin oxidoreductase [Caldilineae bacterium]|nr:MAG: pyruvate flavodoxin/ferredoxin oxidoreductase [Caldilineae bacterium]
MTREYVDGATAIARAALRSGCDFFAGYPISPATPILLHMLRELPKVGGVGIEAEDEIGAISMCIGAAVAGARPMTATSGPGISLYSENIGLAIMGETPLVIVDVMRMGPATGGATTTAQGDVQFIRWGTSGGYPIIALSPSSVGECYLLTQRAFDLAERLRTPVFLLTDKDMVMSMATVDVDEYHDIPIGSRPRVPPAKPPAADGTRINAVTGRPDGRLRPEETYLPYDFEPIDVIPPTSPFGGPHITRFTTSCHDEHAFLTKDPQKVARLNEHLRAKIESRRHELEFGLVDRCEDAQVLFISYGTTARAMREAVARTRAEGIPASALTLHTLWPVPEQLIIDAARGHTRVVVAELNHGQYAREVERILYRHAALHRLPPPTIISLTRVDGRLLTPEQFLAELPSPQS